MRFDAAGSPFLRLRHVHRWVIVVALAVANTSPTAAAPDSPRFESDVRPILSRVCFECHGKKVQESQLDLRTVTAVLQGGESGHAIVRGDPKRSLLLDMLDRQQMPPDSDKLLSAAESDMIRRWIKAGAPADEEVIELPPRSFVTQEDREFWSFARPLQSRLPPVTATDRVRTPLDSFVLHKLEAKDLSLSKDAQRETLARRAYFNLLGLPPTPDELAQFLADKRPDAWERLIDRLLASPRYGERWGRHWLDAVGYVDNRLFDGDLATIYPNEGIWRYRDYVIRTLNEDRPYDRFLTEQLAGDELVDWRNADAFTPEMVELLEATGFYRSIEDHTSEPQYGIAKRYEVVFDTMKMISTSVMGLTLECCRCHTHKFDPIPQRDYFRLMATIEPALNPNNWKHPQDRWLPDVSFARRSEIDQDNARVDAQVAELDKQRKAAEAAKDQQNVARLATEIAKLQQSKQHYGKIQALWDVGPAPRSRILRRGDALTPGIPVEPGFLEVLSTQDLHAVRPEDTKGDSSGTRLALARWLTGREHPLTARVIVNRVWHHHFGRGIVSTPGNFGRSGSPPTHPELLDWLAVDLIEHGWVLKRLHRLIMTSSVFRQSSTPSRQPDKPSPAAVDPENLLLWRMPLRRLEAEIVRDAVLAVSGELNVTAGGPPVMISKPVDGLSREEATPNGNQLRRSVYLFARRVYPLKFLEAFDAPIMPVNCTQRAQSATVLQSFTQLNDSFMLDQAAALAKRVTATAGDPIIRVWRIVLSREPSLEESSGSREFLQQQGAFYADLGGDDDASKLNALTDLCHMLLCTNEFLYVE